ncbi:NADH dehydrogenase [ubiquinone] 1 alpha subcomplex assembly factor 2 [Protopterus annectens]|uniref:NADH dehydrogenase [ubiquinone] 1 alpha subcomplex assembly factor 2 n=1 Tax=Protopterus annectens TaxID=7888 RepID=UPI001CFB8CE3|nr:NADH dehydrogenase [ubiquinone] 1 alpha subcomplex assembly factor 2 [Protopterus annectens]
MNKLRQLIQIFAGPVKHLIGTDHLGNKYYYVPRQKSWTGQTIRERRIVEAANHLEEYEYEAGKIPSEWDAWIRGRREDPPALEELLRNEQYRNEIKIRAKQAEEKDSAIQTREYEEGLVAKPVKTHIKGHASAAYYGKEEITEEPSSAAEGFQPGSWIPPNGSTQKR